MTGFNYSGRSKLNVSSLVKLNTELGNIQKELDYFRSFKKNHSMPLPLQVKATLADMAQPLD